VPDDAAPDPEPVRVDKWLWAARFVKNRALAVELVKGGHVEVNGNKAKPSKEIRPGDRVQLTLGESVYRLVVLRTDGRRGPATQAQLMYRETAEHKAERERLAEERRLEWGAAGARPVGDRGERPTKRDRRRLEATQGIRRGRR
jgi:ribosome-associated heat shock protein Hsp15